MPQRPRRFKPLRHRAKRRFGLSSVADAHSGLVVAVQRTDSALRLNVHFHALALDGVYVREGDAGSVVFHALPTPTRDEVTDVARRTAERVEEILRAQGRSLDPAMHGGEPHPLELEQPGLACPPRRSVFGTRPLARPDRTGHSPHISSARSPGNCLDVRSDVGSASPSAWGGSSFTGSFVLAGC